mgnify:FL=1
MKFTISWLKEYLDTQKSDQELIDSLTNIGLEVEDVINTSEIFSNFIVAQVVEEKKHPNADKLKVCKVDIGSDIVDVVCGAPNVEENMKVVYAPPGSTIPSTQMKLKASKIRGVESLGMMCSEFELGISDDHDGIIKLDNSVKVGQPYAEIAGLNDTMIEIGITPNRQDCLGVSGIARDLSAAGLGTLNKRNIKNNKGKLKSPIQIEIVDNHACPAFAGRYIKNVKNIESPDWLKNKLKSIGLRPISALVDITNFVMFDMNRPLHVYDADKIDERIIVRSSQKGESFRALDDKEYHLEDGMCVIADKSKVLGLGGIMGGDETGCTPSTVNVLLESALFDSVNTAKTGRQLSILSDARYRFERGVDPNSVETGIDLASQLITEICGGELSETIIAGKIPIINKTISLSIDRLKKRLGIDINEKETQIILKNLGIKTTKKGNDLLCEIPSWRHDINEEADLSEEVIRIKGYEFLPTLDIRSPNKVNKLILNESQKRISRSKRLLASKSYNELITWSFSSSEDSSFYNNLENLKILNPISEELDVLRPSLVPNLISAVKKNLARDHSSFSFFEIGNQFLSSNPGDQICVACGIRAGIKQAKDWRDQENLYDVYDVKRDMIDVINHILPQKNKLEVINEAPSWYHPGRSGTLMLNKSIKAGFFGELNPKIANFYKIKDRINLFEIFLDDIPFISKKSTNKPVFNQSNYQKVYRDFAFVIDSNIDGNDIVLSALKVDQNLIKSVDIFDIFTDPSLGKNKKSLAIKVTMQAQDRTLSENEIQDLCSKIISTIEKETSGTVRS